MKYTPERIAQLKKAFGIMSMACAITNVFGNNEGDKTFEYSNAILRELDRDELDPDHLELLMVEVKEYMEIRVKELIANDK